MHLSGDAENILAEQHSGQRIILRRAHIEEVQMKVIVLQPLAQDMDYPLAPQPLIQILQEFLLGQLTVTDMEFFEFPGLGILQKPEQTGSVHRKRHRVILIRAYLVIVLVMKIVNNQLFKPVLLRIRRHPQSPPHPALGYTLAPQSLVHQKPLSPHQKSDGCGALEAILFL